MELVFALNDLWRANEKIMLEIENIKEKGYDYEKLHDLYIEKNMCWIKVMNQASMGLDTS